MEKLCVLDPKKNCISCGDCDRCDLDPNKICDNCEKCLFGEADYRAIGIDKIIMDEDEQKKSGE